MNLLHRSAKRILLNRPYSTPFTCIAGVPLHSFLHRYLLEDEPAQKNIINECTRHFSVFAEDQTALKNQQQGCLSTDSYQDVSLSQCMLSSISEERKCNREGLEHCALELAGGAAILHSVAHVNDCRWTFVNDSVSTCVLASRKGYEKRLNFVVQEAKTASQTTCTESVSELVVAGARTIFHKNNKKRKQFDIMTSEPVDANFLSKQKRGNKHFDGSASELALLDPCKISSKDIDKEKHLNSSLQEPVSETGQTSKFPSKDKQGHIVKDSTSEFVVCNIKTMSRNHTGKLVRKEGLKLSLDNTETSLQREDIGMFRVKDASEVCVRNAKISSTKNAEEGTCNGFCGFLKGVGPSEKIECFTKEQGLVSQRHKREDFAMPKIKKDKKKKKSYNTNIQFGHEDLKHLNLKPHPVRTQTDSLREVNPGITDEFVEELFICENSSKSRLDQDQKSGKVSNHVESIEQSEEGQGEFLKNPSWEVEQIKCQAREHKTRKIPSLWEKGPPGWREDANRPLLTEKEQAYFNALTQNEVIDKGSSQTHLVGKRQNVDSLLKPHMYKENEVQDEAGGNFLGNKGEMIDYNQIKDGTSLDPPSNFWERVRTITLVEKIECGVERAERDLAGVRKVHYALRNHRELYIILDLNGVLIKRWDKNPSLPGVRKLNKKWIQLRPGCIEFLQKAFSSFRVGIWSTMTQRNALNICNFLEQQAQQSLPFFMLWSKDSCYQHRGVQRPNKANVVADFKPLSRVWGYFKPYLGFHNTVLVDDSPYKACMNNPFNCIFPYAFEGRTEDKYLNDVLWPYLEKMRMSHNIQAYIANNPLGQLPVMVGHELYHHVHQVMDVFDHHASLPRSA